MVFVIITFVYCVLVWCVWKAQKNVNWNRELKNVLWRHIEVSFYYILGSRNLTVMGWGVNRTGPGLGQMRHSPWEQKLGGGCWKTKWSRLIKYQGSIFKISKLMPKSLWWAKYQHIFKYWQWRIRGVDSRCLQGALFPKPRVCKGGERFC